MPAKGVNTPDAAVEIILGRAEDEIVRVRTHGTRDERREGARKLTEGGFVAPPGEPGPPGPAHRCE